MRSERQARSDYADLVLDAPQDFKVHTRVYTDPGIFEDEMRHIFETTWVYVAHESELASAGDYRTAAVGRMPVIVTRDADGQVHVLLNVCRHRGSVVCREERGNASHFRCPYHNWVYSNDGTLLGIPDRSGYPEGWGKDLGGLVKAPRVESYRGMIFASFNPDIEDVVAYLGPLKTYVDYWFDHSPSGRVKVLTPYRSVYPANWKFQLENSTDGWHARYVHESALKTMHHFGTRSPASGWPGCARGFDQGHGVLERLRNDIPPDTAAPFQEHVDLLARHYGADVAEQIYVRRHITIFPNLQLMEFKLRIIQPVAVDRTIVYEYPVELEGVPDPINQAIFSRISQEVSVSSGSFVSGFVNADDAEIFARVQTGVRAARLEWFDMSRGLHREVRQPSGDIAGDNSDEVPQRAIYRAWARLMAAGREGQPCP